jgi:hypothetical protein
MARTHVPQNSRKIPSTTSFSRHRSSLSNVPKQSFGLDYSIPLTDSQHSLQHLDHPRNQASIYSSRGSVSYFTESQRSFYDDSSVLGNENEAENEAGISQPAPLTAFTVLTDQSPGSSRVESGWEGPDASAHAPRQAAKANVFSLRKTASLPARPRSFSPNIYQLHPYVGSYPLLHFSTDFRPVLPKVLNFTSPIDLSDSPNARPGAGYSGP